MNYYEELAKLDPDTLRQLLSKLAIHTPNSVYFSADFCADLQKLAAKEPLGELEEGGEVKKNVQMSNFQAAVMFIAAAAYGDGRITNVGDSFTGTVHTLVHGGVDIGNYRVTVEKLEG
jgi:hypothetical protein